MTFFDDLFSCGVMAILRGMDPERTATLAERAWDLGIDAVEVPIETPGAEPSLRAAIEAGARRGRPVGAGTVVGVEQLRTATELGAAFTVAPGLDPELVRASELPHLPGVATPSEVQHARKLGLTWVKAFPATVLGTGWFAAIRGPFPGMRFTATGGMNAHTSSPPGRRWAPSGRRWRIPSSCPRCGASSSEGRESASE
ncbi:2-keto-3-deoxy-phosphogluconate aldolase [Saccharopolyspora erythraea NRRL 2338]|uniref:2-dehydro-3-deoxyphosphogluconate aldolase / 4-hydroxy-2-oxoglutarate aldolase n=2 Tax=Saccharopolyspora erythraea TaxID=1836 RepID=A4FM80_SACEN|nr:bifunctional 4-hydroxy-2-oxoglutarate aldolase/2-dehydro-3-deoxy-phosphogluconate aldolase [Saccharopolyspora erythraea]EQD87746.1 2-keto-3-deoxy-phosphogluconate aldolase [Saccharopolyspora erythraea D]PFG98792.1 2-keto-3-deoxy-phosphogluconate aldolase [Saccharopolyspora erythraea NRRL 2338]CAM05155.1 2-dehydro-3-deoxyphosphogluconate aldolase / 4-hydroxy-2-oxoglutarate aldolase [Saccharopolyspora erythraea NRRL 2338]